MSFLKTSTCLFIIKSRLEEDRLLSQKPRLMTRESVRWAKEPGSGVDAVQVHRVESPTPLSPAGPRKVYVVQFVISIKLQEQHTHSMPVKLPSFGIPQLDVSRSNPGDIKDLIFTNKLNLYMTVFRHFELHLKELLMHKVVNFLNGAVIFFVF